MSKALLALLLASATALAPSLALAHVGIDDTSGVMRGFMHPISGIDHILAMMAVGLFAAHLGGRALWLVPLAFLGMMAFGGALGMSGVGLPYVEVGIALSVVVLGLLLASRANPPVALAMALVGSFAIFHGHAHGAEMPDTASGLLYAVGLIVATASLHAIGIAFGVLIGKAGRISGPRMTRFAGSATAIAGVALLGGLI